MASGDTTERLVWIDWLKIIVVFAVFVYHTAEPFLVINWLVSNDERSTALSALAGFASGRGGGMADALVSGTSGRKVVWVRVPPSVPFLSDHKTATPAQVAELVYAYV